MVIKNSGTLSKDYFISYLKLRMNANNLSFVQAKDVTFEQFFQSDKDRYGKSTYKSFLQACETLEEEH